ncbi:phosphopantothenate--cysteine ligase [Clostridia bacterium]|nr:phosphopantothenate--cysteine ligase [Clostridia bacterium]
MLNILVTAGNTSEKIDDARRVSNTGTGKLGALIAESFVAAEENVAITYVCSGAAARPRILGGSTGSIDVRIADDVRSLTKVLQKVCADKKFDIVIHTMAVSDYYVGAVTDADKLAEAVVDTTRNTGPAANLLKKVGPVVNATKIRETLYSPPEVAAAINSADHDNIIVVLHRAPKIISLLRGLAPDAVITAFNLLVGAGEVELVNRGRRSIERYHCDFILANDMTTVRSNRQEGFLISKNDTYERAVGKGSIAMLIVLRSLEAAHEKESNL